MQSLTRIPGWLLLILIVGSVIVIAVIIELFRGRTTHKADNMAPVGEVDKKEQPKGIFLGSLSFAFMGAAILTLVTTAALAFTPMKDDSSWVELVLFPALALGSAVVGLRQASRESRVTLGAIISGCAVVASLLLIVLFVLILKSSR